MDFSEGEHHRIADNLRKQLGPEFLSSRAGAGGQKVFYITADKCINLANEIFGFNGWSSSIMDTKVDFFLEVDICKDTAKVSLGISVVMRVTLKDGTYHEDIGYGHIENCKGKAAAFEKARKEGATDALKRALRNFGNALGNCIYDKRYLSDVVFVEKPMVQFDRSTLYRSSMMTTKTNEEQNQSEKQAANLNFEQGPSTLASSKEVISEDYDVRELERLGFFDSEEFDDFAADPNVSTNKVEEQSLKKVRGIASERVSKPNSQPLASCHFTSARTIALVSSEHKPPFFDIRRPPLFSSLGVNHKRSEPIMKSKLVDKKAGFKPQRSELCSDSILGKRRAVDSASEISQKRPSTENKSN